MAWRQPIRPRRGRARNSVTGPCCPPEREGKERAGWGTEARARDVFSGGRHCPVVLRLWFVFWRCFRGSPRSYLFAQSPASLYALEARRHRRLRLCYPVLRTERSGTAFRRCWPCRSSGNPRPPSGAFRDRSPASWGRCSSPRDLRDRCFKSEEREIPER